MQEAYYRSFDKIIKCKFYKKKKVENRKKGIMGSYEINQANRRQH